MANYIIKNKRSDYVVREDEIYDWFVNKDNAVLCDYENKPFEFVVIDESQDISVSQLRFLAALGGNRPNALFFAGDLGQRIFQQPFSWKSLGVDVRGRSRTLRVNYRTSHQIRTQADRLLAACMWDRTRMTHGRELSPLPVLGVPGWWKDNEQESFYDNTGYFRPGRASSGIPDQTASSSV